MPFPTTWIDLEITILNEVSQRKANIMFLSTYIWNLENTNELICKNRLTDITKYTYGYQKGMKEGINQQFGINRKTYHI